MKKKVAIIDHLGAHGSSHHFYLFGQAKGLIDNNINVSLYTNSATIDPKIINLQFFQFYKNIFSRNNKLLSLFRYLLGSLYSHFHARLNSCKIFHYHLFGSSLLVIFNMIIAKLLLVKIALTIHDVQSFSKKNKSSFYSKIIYFFSDVILTHNQFSKEEMILNQPFLKNKIEIIPHGNYIPFINIENDQQASRNRIQIPLDKKVLLFFGMIKTVKGLDVLLNAMPEIIKCNNDILLLIAGKPWRDDFSKYEKLIDDLKIKDYCKLDIKFIDHKDVASYYSASDVVVLPYRKIYQSGVLMMSLCYKKPVIVSNLPSFKEIVDDKKTALFFKSEDSNSLSLTVNDLINNEDLMSDINKNAYKLMLEKFNWTQIGKLTSDAYNKIGYFYKK